MSELTLKFEDENGVERRFSVRQEIFTVGRHSGCDLSIADGRLSREHLKIERFGDIFVAADLGSSNGTTVNGKSLESPTKLQNNDLLNLGGLEFKITIASNGYAKSSAAFFDEDEFAEAPPNKEAEKKAETIAPSLKSSNPPNAPNTSVSNNSSSIPTSFFIIAPLFGFIVLLLVGVSIYLFSGKSETEIASNGSEFIYTNNDDIDEPKNTNEDNENTGKTPSSSNVNSSVEINNNSATDTNSSENANSPTPTPANLSETAKIEQNSASFLRKIAQNDPKAFLTSDQSKIVSGKIKQLNTAAIADNIKSARANAAQLQALANSKNLRPQFLASLAIARLGNNRGNVLQTAQGMLDNLDKLSIHVGGERADDALLMVAAFDQSASGKVLDFRNMLQQLSNQFPESSRTIRTIWFLKQKGKISEAEFEFALRFLAIGTVTQNPKDFAVNAEELKLN